MISIQKIFQTKKMRLKVRSASFLPSFKYLVFSLLIASFISCGTGTKEYTVTFTVTFDANDATGGSVPAALTNKTTGAIITLPQNSGNLVREGYTFLGWAVTNTATTPLNSYTMPANNVTLYAVWLGLSNTTITFNGNGSTGGSVPATLTNQTTGAIIPLPQNSGFLVRAGRYKFSGWSISLNGRGINNYRVPANNITLYAVWIPTFVTGFGSTFIIKDDGTLWGTGTNNSGQLGVGDTANKSSFTQAMSGVSTPLTNVRSVFTFNSSTFAIQNNGSLWVAGLNSTGQLGLGNTTNQNFFTQVMSTNAGVTTTLSDVSLVTSQVDADTGGRYYSTLIIKSDGTLWITGKNTFGLPINANTTTFRKVFIDDVVLEVGGQIVLKSNGTVWSSGYNFAGHLGIGENKRNTTSQETFEQSNLSGVVSLGRTGGGTLALKSDGILYFTGQNFYGALGSGLASTTITYTFTKLLSPTKVISFGTTEGFSYGLKSDGTAWAMGGTTNLSRDITKVMDIKGVSSILVVSPNKYASSSSEYAFATLKTNGTLWGIGSNSFGQLGVGDTTYSQDSLTQAMQGASALTGVSTVVSNDNSTFAIKTDGTIWATGSNTTGTLGLGDTTDRNTFTAVTLP